MPESPGHGIRWHAGRQKWAVSVEVSAGSKARRLTRKRYYPEATPVRDMRAWQDAARVQLRARLAEDQARQPDPPDPSAPVTLQDAATLYLATVTAMPSYDSRRHDLQAWTKAIGDVRLADLSARDLRLVWNSWKAERRAVSTLQHRRTALFAALALVAPEAHSTAKAALPRPKDALGLPRELPYPTITAILAAMPPSQSSAMLGVMAETGLPAMTLRRLRPEDVDLERATVRLPPRRKGQTAHAVTLPLTPAAVEAFRVFAARGAWGGVTKTSLCSTWSRACARVRTAGTPVPPCAPYILRHSFAGRVLDATGGDLQATKELLQQADIETTLRYVRARVSRGVAAAVRALS